jgi:4-amino-4-deoxy-L-arabinose transferase-like glycosyltransferase
MYNTTMFKSLILLFISTLLAAVLRFFNLSPFTIYPDSYQNLLVAENIAKYHSVLGYLGPDGMLYPDFFMWTRPIYALLINSLTFFLHDTFLTARVISFFAGVFAVLLAFIAITTLFKNKKMGLVAAGLLALSYNHTIWSGFVMTETTGVFFMLLFLWILFHTIFQTTKYGNFRDIIIGILFSLAVMARYEYLIILLPVILLIMQCSPQPFKRILNISAAFLVCLVLFGLALFPLDSVIFVILNQLKDLLLLIGIGVAVFVFSILLYYFLPKRYQTKVKISLPTICIGIIILFAGYIILQIFFGASGWPLWNNLSFLRNFARHDMLISLFSVIGFILIFQNKRLRAFGYFSLLSSIFLLSIYYKINPDMERYVTHIIPFLLIPASYGLVNLYVILPRVRMIGLLLLVPLVLIQFFTTANGLRSLNDQSWYHMSYEEKVAVEVKRYTTNNPILLASTPEPYYYRLRFSTQSLTDSPPYLYIPDSLDNRTVLIIEDMGMREIFPTFTYLLDTKLQQYKIAEFKVNEYYHTNNKSTPETQPVVLYEVKLGDLKKLLEVGIAKNNIIPRGILVGFLNLCYNGFEKISISCLDN